MRQIGSSRNCRFKSELSVPDGQAWFVVDAESKITAFRLKDAAETQKEGGEMKNFEAAKLVARTAQCRSKPF